ncbi:MAG: hypothetical protein ACTHJT_05540 [Cytophaga sp.]|uniref:hypothetical protein n=1 Tax=Cytophaga sp. TaxID=29535 RepID=UPI003F7E65DB
MNILKKSAFYTILFLSTTVSVQAQKVEDIFSNTDYTVTWMGIDYSHAKVVGSVIQWGFNPPVTKNDLKDRYFAAWNYLFLDEADKYNIAEMLHRKYVNTDISMIKKINDNTSVDSIEVKITPYYSLQDIQSFVSAYPAIEKPGIGLVFITESMNKTAQEAFYHVVFFNTQTKEVLLHERMRGTPGGSGVRNYWAGSYYKIIETIESTTYSKWKAKFGGKAVNKPAPTW